MVLTERERVALTYIRVLAMVSIVVCHLFQGFGLYHYSSVFNVGVQVFLILSGFLYGSKIVSDWKGFLLGRIKKLYLPTIIVLIVFVGAYSVAGGGNGS